MVELIKTEPIDNEKQATTFKVTNGTEEDVAAIMDTIFGEECEDDEPYTPSATNGDYSPSCPWNAPGMSIHDFI